MCVEDGRRVTLFGDPAVVRMIESADKSPSTSGRSSTRRTRHSALFPSPACGTLLEVPGIAIAGADIALLPPYVSGRERLRVLEHRCRVLSLLLPAGGEISSEAIADRLGLRTMEVGRGLAALEQLGFVEQVARPSLHLLVEDHRGGERALEQARASGVSAVSTIGRVPLIAPPAGSPEARRVMQGNRSLKTRPEMAIRSAVHRLGLRFRKHHRPVESVPCRADLVFTRDRVAVFVDGCFWHRCPDHGVRPTTNRPYWDAKFARNLE